MAHSPIAHPGAGDEGAELAAWEGGRKVEAMNTTRKNLITRADALTKEVVFLCNDGKCLRCESPAVDPAHIIGRRHLRHRWRIFNVMPLCRHCHTWFDVKATKNSRLRFLEKHPEYFECYNKADKISSGTVPTSFIREQIELLKKIKESLGRGNL